MKNEKPAGIEGMIPAGFFRTTQCWQWILPIWNVSIAVEKTAHSCYHYNTGAAA